VVNSATGTTTVSQGQVTLGAANALGNASTVSVAGGQFALGLAPAVLRQLDRGGVKTRHEDLRGIRQQHLQPLQVVAGGNDVVLHVGRDHQGNGGGRRLLR
jgi:hypothetical protein